MSISFSALLLLAALSCASAFPSFPSFGASARQPRTTTRRTTTRRTASFARPATMSMSSSPMQLLRSKTPFVLGSVHQEIPGATPYLTYYYPLKECGSDFFCRAEMTVYREFSGATVVQVGMSVWNFNGDPDGPIPYYLTSMIASTTSPTEAVLYTDSILPAIQNMYNLGTYPPMCDVDLNAADEGFVTAAQLMTQCYYLTDYVCDQKVTVAKC